MEENLLKKINVKGLAHSLADSKQLFIFTTIDGVPMWNYEFLEERCSYLFLLNILWAQRIPDSGWEDVNWPCV